jgi:hypothetical protein
MANKLPNEKELLEQLHNDRASIPGDLWPVVYANVEDSILVIKLIVRLYEERNEDVPPEETKKILDRVGKVAAFFNRAVTPKIIKTADKGLVKVGSEIGPLHPILREMLKHYIGNDIQALNFILGDLIDDGRGLDAHMKEKVLRRIAAMEEILKKLRLSTSG